MLDCIRNAFQKKLRILVVGSDGMLGKEVLKEFQRRSFDKNSSISKCIGYGRKDIQLGQFSEKFVKLCQSGSVDVVVNCAAFTDTAKCEDKAFLKQSYEANVLGVQQLASTCAYYKVKFVHISTDYVYSHYSYNEQPWIYEFPCNTYGMQKLLAEEKIKTLYARWPKGHLICRMSWLYGITNKDLFMYKILASAYKAKAQLMNDSSQKGVFVQVVDDQIGVPQSAYVAGQEVANLVCQGIYGTVNCWNKQYESRASFAQKIFDCWSTLTDNLLDGVKIKCCKSTDFQSAVQHPLFDKSQFLPIGYISTNASSCRLGSGSAFSRMMIKVDQCLEDCSQLQSINDFICQNKDQIEAHVLNMLPTQTRDLFVKMF